MFVHYGTPLYAAPNAILTSRPQTIIQCRTYPDRKCTTPGKRRRRAGYRVRGFE